MKMLKYILIGLLLWFVIELYIDNHTFEITKYRIKDKKIGNSFQNYKIVQLSDLHGKRFGRNNTHLLRTIDKIQPNLIVMTGDMVNNANQDFETLFALISSLYEKYPIYYIKGNHEQGLSSENKKVLYDFLIANEVKYLENEKDVIKIGKDSINLFGMWSDLAFEKQNGEKKFSLSYMKKLMENAPISKNEFNILLAHNPNQIDIYSKWGADLTLSGHIHGGMVRLPIVGGIFSPDTFLFPKFSKGKYEVNGKSLIVSRGLGRGRRGFRLFNRPELAVIELENM